MEKNSEEKAEGTFSITISEDKMSALLDLVPSAGGGTPLSFENVKAKAASLGIVHGVDFDYLKSLVEEVEESKSERLDVSIARGTPPTEGTDAEFKFHFSEDDSILKSGGKGGSNQDETEPEVTDKGKTP